MIYGRAPGLVRAVLCLPVSPTGVSAGSGSLSATPANRITASSTFLRVAERRRRLSPSSIDGRRLAMVGGDSGTPDPEVPLDPR